MKRKGKNPDVVVMGDDEGTALGTAVNKMLAALARSVPAELEAAMSASWPGVVAEAFIPVDAKQDVQLTFTGPQWEIWAYVAKELNVEPALAVSASACVNAGCSLAVHWIMFPGYQATKRCLKMTRRAMN